MSEKKQTFDDKWVKGLEPDPNKRLAIRDPGYEGLYIRITPKGMKSFCAVARGPGGKQVWATIGKTDHTALADARNKAGEAIGRIKRGLDPFEQAPEPQERITYEAAVEDYITRYQIGKKEAATAGEVKRVLLKEGAEWRKRRIENITAPEITRLVESIRDGNRTTKKRLYLANRFFAYLRTFFAWASKPDIRYRDASPMIGLDKPWDKEKPRTRVFSDDELKRLWESASKLNVYGGALLKILILTGKRKGALVEMRYSEIDEDGIWTPQNETENKRRHKTPLAQSVLDILAELPEVEGNDHVFVGRHDRGHLVPGTSLQSAIQRVSGVEDFFYHAARHTVETRLAKLKIPPHVRDLCLDHAPQRGSGKDYDHYDYSGEIGEAYETWSNALMAIVGDDAESNVVPMKRGQ